MAIKLFLDVDGVLNAFDESAFGDAVRRPAYVDGCEWLMNCSPSVGPKLLACGVEIEWLTTWMHDAPTQIAPLVGLPADLAVAGDRDVEDWNWKYTFIKSYHDSTDDPFVWVDDAEIPFTGAHELDLSRCLLVRTDPQSGITEAQIDVIAAWVKEQIESVERS